uniref:Putative hig1 domain family member 2a mitochondrial n=1 Tax=Amblyomma tuberculatum TaxID=48802 RepID=A0A6M2E4C8_9ACAR
MADHPKHSQDDELEWIAIEKSFREDDAAAKEKRTTLMKNKIASNPFVPLGLLATVTALGFGLKSMYKGQTRQSQMMMRTRVVCQGLTFVAILVGIVMGARGAQQKPQ